TISEITEFTFEIPTGIVADAYSRRLSVIIGTLMTGMALVLAGFMSSFLTIAFSMMLWSVGFTFLSGAREAWITDEVGPEHIGRVFLRTTQVRQAAKIVGVIAGAALASVNLRL